MTQEEINKVFPSNTFTYNSKKYELKPALVKNACHGCCFIAALDCEKKGRVNVCRDLDVIFSRKL